MNEMASNFLIGWKFPPIFNSKSNKVEMVIESEDIKESLHILFSTKKGERIMRPTYGCDLYKINFEEMNKSTLNLIHNSISEAILEFEKRINISSIQIDVENQIEGFISITVEYVVKNSNNTESINYSYSFL